MPFDEENESPSIKSSKIGLKNVSSQKSIFENMPKKPAPEEFEKQVQQIQNRSSDYKQRAAELAIQYRKILEDKTLHQNKNVFAVELEKEVITKMVQLAIEINNDSNEQEGMGSLGWITLLLKVILSQKDKINNLEYKVSLLERKLEPAYLSAQIIKELQSIDKKKENE